MVRVEHTWDASEMGGGAIDRYPWGGDYRPACGYRVGWNERGLKVILRAAQTDPRRLITEENGDVWLDDCLELFLEAGAGYYNFEMNARGVMLACYGAGRHGRTPIERPADLAASASVTKDAWTVELTVPWTLCTRAAPSFRPIPGARLRANFYKCGDATAFPHYAAAFDIDPRLAPAPDFHRPECFGELTLS